MNYKTRLIIFALACFLFVHSDFAQKKISDKQTASEADKYLSELTQLGRFGGAVLIARSGKIILNKGYGMANLEHGVPNSSQTKFRLASMTKAFTATAIMMLAERGKLNIQDSICKYIAQCPASWQTVTIRQLLNHTSGITEFGKPPPADDCFRRTPMTTAATLERAKQFKPDFSPGEKFAYSSIGYVLLGHIIEKASGTSYEGFLKENILAPLGMKNTGIDRQKEIIKERAIGYRRAKDGSLSNFEYFNLDYLFAAGNLYSTVEDLYLWGRAFDGERLLKGKTLETVFTPGLENSGYGWEIFERGKRRFIRSDGRSFGFTNSMTRYPAEKVLVVVLSNIDTTEAGKISDALAAIVFGEKYENPIQKK